jgi:hypothetical protein
VNLCLTCKKTQLRKKKRKKKPEEQSSSRQRREQQQKLPKNKLNAAAVVKI